jgi:hypothetical protein
MTKNTVSTSEFVKSMTDPTIERPRGRGIHLNQKITMDISRQAWVDWNCPICETHNHQHWYGRDYHICIKCEQPTDIKITGDENDRNIKDDKN